MKIEEWKQTVKKKLTTVAFCCDSCKEIISVENEEMPNSWHKFSLSHFQCGDDFSEHYEVCSAECYLNIVNQLVKE